MPYCAAISCTNKSSKKPPGVSFHMFSIMKFLRLKILICMTVILGRTVQAKVNSQCPNNPLTTSSNDLGYRIHDLIAKESRDNVVISPASIYVALAMLYMGTGGRSAKSIEASLLLRELGLKETTLNQEIRQLMTTMNKANKNYDLSLSNAVFFQEGLKVKDSYVKKSKQFFDATVERVDFKNQKAALKRINRWIREKTKNEIKPEEGDLDARLSKYGFSIVNAIYFKGFWKTKFDKSMTTKSTFNGPKGEKQVDFMNHFDKEFLYFNDKVTKYQFLELPYQGDELVMLIALPKDSHSEAKLKLEPKLLCRIMQKMESTSLSVELPKFKIKTQKFLRSILSNLGMSGAFNSANLTRISGDNIATLQMKHIATIEVDEEGSEAAAVSEGGPVYMSMPISFVADHPFQFYILDKRNHMVLFSGRIVNPEF